MEEGDLFESDDAPPFRSPLPPDDRLWRHPSELGRPPTSTTHGHRGWSLAVASGLSGVMLTLGVLAVTGGLSERTELRPTVIREAVHPAVAAVGSTTKAQDERLADVVGPAIVRLDVVGGDQHVGSGVLIRDDGQVVTNAHVVGIGDRLKAVLSDGRTLDAHVVGIDVETDIAVVKLDGTGPFPTAVLGTTDGLAVGQPAIAVGAPSASGEPWVTRGMVSAVGREIRSAEGVVLADMIQTDATVAAGSSGGALLDGDGTVIGITTAYPMASDGNSSLGFATPVDVARAVADDILTVGHVRAVKMGVRGASSSDGGGVDVAGVTEGGPAAVAGLRAGDIIRRVDNRPAASMTALRITLRRRHPGSRISVVYDRDGHRRTAWIVLAERS